MERNYFEFYPLKKRGTIDTVNLSIAGVKRQHESKSFYVVWHKGGGRAGGDLFYMVNDTTLKIEDVDTKIPDYFKNTTTSEFFINQDADDFEFPDSLIEHILE